jgi:hypothetical protein
VPAATPRFRSYTHSHDEHRPPALGRDEHRLPTPTYQQPVPYMFYCSSLQICSNSNSAKLSGK